MSDDGRVWQAEVRSRLGDVTLWRRGGTQAEVFEAVGAAGTVAWVKRYRTAALAARERHAYTAWIPAAGPGWARYLGAVEGGQTLLLGPVSGAALLPGGPLAAAMEQLGALLARLHAVHSDDRDPLPLAAALDQRARAWGSDAPAWCDAVRARLRRVPPARRVCCHRDVQLHNVWWDGAQVTLLDLGQARLDHPLADVVKLVERSDGPLDPAAREALWSGLGDRPDDAALRAMVALHGLATWAWARRHGDADGARRGAQVVEEALDGGG